MKSLTASVNWRNVALIVLGSVLLALYRYGLQAEGHGVDSILWFIKLAVIQSALYFAAVWIAWRPGGSRSTLIIVLVFGGLFRAGVLFAPPFLSDDLYRYIWDGRVQAAGINPYRYVPADQALESLRDEHVYPNINRRETARTIYPPIAQLFYFLVTRVSESVTWMKAAMVGCETVALALLMILLSSFDWPVTRILVFAWHPLLVWEIAGNGHVDALMIALVTLALFARREQKETLTGLALACATLIKFYPIVLFPALYRRWSWKMPTAFAATICLAYAPYLSVGLRGVLGFLPVYAEHEGLESGDRFFMLAVGRRVISGAPNAAYLPLALGLLAVTAGWSFWKAQGNDTGYLRWSCSLATLFAVLLSPHYTWYFAWLVPFMCFVPAFPLFYLTGASFVLYGTWLGDSPEQLFGINAVLYAPFLILVLFAIAVRYATRWKMNSDKRDRQPVVEELI